jgi:hypothetical protein
MLEEFGPSLYVADGPTVFFLSFPFHRVGAQDVLLPSPIAHGACAQENATQILARALAWI